MNIQDLKSNTTWQEASNTINNNNNKISLAIATLENATLKNKGYFTSVEKLKEAIPNPSVGSKAYVGTAEPYAIYIVDNGVWVDSGYTGGDEIVANITTDRIKDGAVTTEKIATSAFDSTLSVSGKIAPADVVGEKITYLDGKITTQETISISKTDSFIPMHSKSIGDTLSLSVSGGVGYGYKILAFDADTDIEITTIGNTSSAKSFAVVDSNNVILQIEQSSTNRIITLRKGCKLVVNTKVTGDESVRVTKLVSDVLDAKIQENSTIIEKLKATDKMLGITLHVVNGRYLASNGLYVNDLNYKASDLFAVNSGKQYIVKGRIICCYDINKKFISTLKTTDGKITTPDNVKYLAIDSKINGTISVEEEDNPVSGIARTEDIYQLQNNVDRVFLNLIQLSAKYDVYNGKYYATDGKLYNEGAFSSTSLFYIKGDTDYSFPRCYRVCYYTENKELISYEDKKTTSTSPSNASYAAVTIQKSTFPKDSFYFYGGNINDFIVYSNTQSKDEEFDKNTIINNLQNQPSPEISVVSGNYGSIGAKYSIPINVIGKYYLGFDFKYPKDITRASSNRTLLTFKRLSSNINTNGTCIVDVNGSINSFIGQQITSSAQVVAYISSIKNNNYKSVMTTGTGHNKSIFGTDAFALRYIGSNGTPKLTINDNGITIQNDVVTIMNVQYPSDKSVLTLANTLKTLCEDGGELNGVVSFIPYDVFGRSTDELVHCENVPMRTTDANGDYPVYIPYIDDSWHKLEVVFDESGIKGRSLLSIFVDGKRLSYIDDSFVLVGDGIFETSAIIGGEGFDLRNFKFENNSTKIASPLIMVDMLHNVSAALSVGGQDVISVYEIERIIETYRNHGFKYAPLSLVSEYFNGNIKLEGKYFTLVHDDYFYVSRNGEIGEMLNRLYKSKNIKADYAIIPEGFTTTDAERLSHNLSVSEWSYHSESNLGELPYDTLVSKVSSEMLNLEKKIGQVTNTLIYPYGSNTLSTRKTLKHLGFSLASTVGGDFASMANDAMALPRVNRSTGGYENLDNILSALDKYYS